MGQPPAYGHVSDYDDLSRPPIYEEAVSTVCHPDAFADPVLSPSLLPQEVPAMDIMLSGQAYIDWYLKSLNAGAFDHLSYHGDLACPPYTSGYHHSYPYGDHVDPPVLHDGVYQDVKPSVGADDDGTQGQVNANLGPNGPIVYRPSTSTVKFECVDLHDVGLMMDSDSDTTESAVSTTTSVTESEDDVQYVEPEDIVRHYWIRGDIKYTFCHNGHRYYMTAEQMEDRFGGVKFALWHYWKVKRAGKIPYARVIDYLKKNGHQGFFREMLWHLLPKRFAMLLYAARKADTLDDSVWPEYKPKKGGYNKKGQDKSGQKK
ncbi:hypothetical protein QFC24_006907 [Naganishia onofrii]|uniref:Uncharacterized protein n=1 Tax=Naganishia onofrii TaxID=1851511 RepID=A0ACC2WX57_9TREE|nr:hypothetical protein QFC24_006907 [Naganishia onofrii]